MKTEKTFVISDLRWARAACGGRMVRAGQTADPKF
jgi:hypothetical protein